MQVTSVLRMNGGNGDASYAENSILQHKTIMLTVPITEEAITSLHSNLKPCPDCLKIADLGCSSGPNTLLVISQVIKTICKLRRKTNQSSPEIEIYLNDLPGNDFNSVFRSLSSFEERLRNEVGSDDYGHCFFNGVPGSFYDRLFPTNTLHFVHSSYSLMWLSQVPDGIRGNKGNICCSSTSPESVVKAYFKQFHKDFSVFLKCRSVELVAGGYMVLTIFGRKTVDPSCLIWELLGNTLQDMVVQGVIKEEKLHSFNVPLYTPSPDEVKSIIESDGSFQIHRLETSSVDWNLNDNIKNSFVSNGSKKGDDDDDGYNLAKCMRAVAEPIISDHFGEEMVEKVFYRYKEKISDYMAKHTAEFINVSVTISKIKRL